MNKDSIARLAHIAALFFPASQVRYIFEVGAKDAGRAQKLGAAYPLAEMHYFAAADASRLDAFMNERGIGGIDMLWLDAETAPMILKGLSKKLRTVRLIYIEQRSFRNACKPLLRNGFRYFDDGVFVSKDIAPRWLGILRKRIMRLI